MTDFLSDRSGVELARLSRLFPLPGYVKEASLSALREPGALGPTAFADAAGRRFNCDTRPAAYLSALYFHGKAAAEMDASTRDRVGQRLAAFADYWGIRPEYDAVVKRAADLKAAAEAPPPESDFALPGRRLPLRTPAEVKEAAAALFGARDSLDYAARRAAASRVLEKAAAYGAALGEDLEEATERAAGRGVCRPSDVVAMLRGRAKHAQADPRLAPFRAEFERLADAVDRDRRRFCNPDNLAKLAEVVDGVDAATGLRGNYSALLPRPEDVCFALSFRKAASYMADRCRLTTGSVYHKEAFAKLALDDVRSVFGDSLADEVRDAFGRVDPEKAAEVFATLPRPDAELLDQVLVESGLHPTLAKSASDAKVGLSDEELLRYARLY